MLTAHTNSNIFSGNEEPQVPGLSVSVLKILAYFDMFRYPLTLPEIKQFLDQPAIGIALEKTIMKLVESKKVFQLEGFYSLRNEPGLPASRLKGNAYAEKLLDKAQRIGKFLHVFPFVRGVAISGSLSKSYAEPDADIDFFIITRTNRLWIARTFMHIFKKLTYLLGRQHFYCMNYYIDESALTVKEKNIYTAIEIKTLLPVTAPGVFEKFFIANDWTGEYLPVCNHRMVEDKKGDNIFKILFEKCLNGKTGDNLDNYLMRLTTRRWKRKEARGLRNKKGLMMGLITGKHFARSNPDHFQEKLLAHYQEKLGALLEPVISSEA